MSTTVSIKVTLSSNAKSTNLLSGPHAANLVGDPDTSDIILQASPGEFILACTEYLKRNVYFAAHQRVNESGLGKAQETLKVNPPFPSYFRLVLECIYAHSEEYCTEVFSKSNFGPLLMNGYYVQEENIVAAGCSWFRENWKVASRSHTFCSANITKELVEKLLEKFNKEDALDAAVRFEILLEWGKDWERNNLIAELRCIVDREIKFECITNNQWENLVQRYATVIPFCVVGKLILGLFAKVRTENEMMEALAKKKTSCRCNKECICIIETRRGPRIRQSAQG
ncbi:hypothetical protein HDU79_010819 [Rhizoclosmatium sp. JEL0117]|nr:hypothetical protein HDU79_010819 [Rhizoclosmatium sp. JEL0117]